MTTDSFKLTSSQLPVLGPAVTAGRLPTTRQIYQLRRNFGVNIGSCFVMEKWIFHRFFGGNAECELDAANYLIRTFGEDEARRQIEEFWSLFMSDGDWQWLKDRHVTAVRVPLGYWDIGGGRFITGTKFEPVKHLYRNAWHIFKTKFVEKAGHYGIGIHFDLHALPYGANTADHSGEHGSGGSADFWKKREAQNLMCEALKYAAQELRHYDNITGIGIVNEAEFSNETQSRAEYYVAAVKAIRAKDDSIPIFISEGWWPNQWVQWLQGQQKNGNCGIVIDTHCYRCFSEPDKQKSPQQIIDALDGDFLTNLTANGAGVDFVVGEYSCVLDGASWNRDNANANRDNLVTQFGRLQQYVFQQRAKCGSYFWTYKFQVGDGGEWGFRPMVEKGAIIPPQRSSKHPTSQSRDQKLDANYNEHTRYWDNNGNGANFEHYRYRDGFKTAWDDASAFAHFDSSSIGRIEAWKAARLQQHIAAKGNLGFVWEWEQGFDKGLQEFYDSY